VPGLIAPQVRPEGTVSVSATTPVNPLIPVTVMVDVELVPALTAAGDLAVIWKFGRLVIWNTAVAVWSREPLIPAIVSV
jgi:hypothetical protein